MRALRVLVLMVFVAAAESAVGAQAAPPDGAGRESPPRARAVPDQLATDPPELSTARTDAERSAIRLRHARMLVTQANAEADPRQAEQLRAQARTQIEAARALHHAAHDRFKAKFEEFPRFIPPDQPDQQQARAAAELGYITAQIELAKSSYETAQTWADGTDEQTQALRKAAEEFQRIHERYRSMFVGLVAYLWQGKCFQEMGDIRKALGIYNEILGHEARGSRTLQNLQSTARHLRLVCLNDPQRKDSLVVIREATEWLDAAGDDEQESATGLGIRWERARAYEQLADAPDTPDADRKSCRTHAAEDAGFVHRFDTPFRTEAGQMLERLRQNEAISAEAKPGMSFPPPMAHIVFLHRHSCRVNRPR